MILEYQENDTEDLMKVWRRSSSQAHSFLLSEFVNQVERDIREEFLPNARTYVFKADSAILGFIWLLQHDRLTGRGWALVAGIVLIGGYLKSVSSKQHPTGKKAREADL